MTRTPTRCWPEATPWASSSSMARPCDPCCVSWDQPASMTSLPCWPCTDQARWVPMRTSHMPSARTTENRSSRSIPNSRRTSTRSLLPRTTSSCTRSRSCRSPGSSLATPWVARTFCVVPWARRRSTSWRRTSSPSRLACVNTGTPTTPSRPCGTSWSPSPDTPSTSLTLPVMDWSPTGRPISRPTTRPSTELPC